MVTVTGANGFVGNNLVRELTGRGRQVRCMVRKTSDLRSLQGLDVELVTGDVRDRASLETAFAGADVVYHLAAVIAIAPGRERQMAEVNAAAPRMVAAACAVAGVRRLVHVASCHALKEPPHGEVFDERQPFDPAMWMPYGREKAVGALGVLAETRRTGLDAVIACPTGIVGPHDYRPSEMGRTVLDFARGKLAAITPGGYDFVDVRDVVTGLIALAERGRGGEYYLLGGKRVDIAWIVAQLTALLGPRSRPRLLDGTLLNLVANVVPLVSRLTGTPPRITKDSVATLLSNSDFSSAKAAAEVGYRPRPLSETLSDTVEWLRESGRIA